MLYLKTSKHSNRIICSLVIAASLAASFPAFANVNSTTENSSMDVGHSSEPEHSHEITTSIKNSVPNDPYSRQYGANFGVQFPTGLALELNYRLIPEVSFGISGGGFALDNVINDGNGNVNAKNQNATTSVGIAAIELKARYHPFGRSFFIGLAGGWQKFFVNGFDKIPSNSASLERLYLTPHLGWLWVLNSGLTLGTEFGVLVPVSDPTLQTNSAGKSYSATVKDLKASVLPYLTFIKVGYTF